MPASRAGCIGSKSFDPNTFFKTYESGKLSIPEAETNDLRSSICQSFDIPDSDTYVYHAIASVNLHQVQQAISAGSQHGLHAWYRDQDSKQLAPPSIADIEAYTTIFASTTSTDKSLKAFASNAKKDSIRARVAQNLLSKRTFPANLTIPKLKKPQANPYLDFWTWSCKCLEWCGPEEATADLKQSHHALPVFYHHFGCVVPSYEALEAIKQLAANRPVIDAGSGNGYWTYMLRRMGLEVTPVDNGDSVWRTMWVDDTVKMDAGKYIEKQKRGSSDCALLMVYPQVTTDFTKDALNAYKGGLICVSGTQNSNTFTADVEALLQKHTDDWEKIVQTPLPSFAGKDEAFYVWKKKKP